MKAMQRKFDPSRQNGQSSLWFLAMMATCCAVFGLVYNIGQVTNQKEQTINAADAAALSGAMVEARMLNFASYANRATVANEVTVGQLVSLESWLNYDNQMVQTVAEVCSWVPALGQAIESAAQAVQTATDTVNAGIQAGIYGADAIVSVMLQSQSQALSVGADAADQVSASIAQANATTFGNRYDESPDVFAGNAGFNTLNKAYWNAFTSTSGNAQADEKRNDRRLTGWFHDVARERTN